MKIHLSVIVPFLFFAVNCTWGADSDIRLNSLGFLPAMPKKATIISECSTFTVKNVNASEIVFSGTVTGPITQKDVNQVAWLADFSAVTEKGKFYLEVAGVGRSIDFEIGDMVYDFAYYTVMRGFYLWRCGTAVG